MTAMMVGAGLESDWRISASGGGAFQITDHVSFSPTDINAAVSHMWPRYFGPAVLAASQTESSNKYADIAYKAERPAVPYQQSQSKAKVDSVYQTVVQNGAGPGSNRYGTNTDPSKRECFGRIPLFSSRYCHFSEI